VKIRFGVSADATLNLGIVGFKQELSNNQVTARIGYKF